MYVLPCMLIAAVHWQVLFGFLCCCSLIDYFQSRGSQIWPARFCLSCVVVYMPKGRLSNLSFSGFCHDPKTRVRQPVLTRCIPAA
jgi:NADH:ubiquinone oxidoreductase subunit B-like Fe-S oxidoreductase